MIIISILMGENCLAQTHLKHSFQNKNTGHIEHPYLCVKV